MRVIDFFDKAVVASPDRAAFVSGTASYSYAEMQTLSIRIAVAVRAHGLSDAGRVAVYSPNDVDAFACVLAGFRANATWVPINARNALEANIDFMNLTECEWLFYHSSFAANVREIRAQVPSLLRTVCIDRTDDATPALSDFVASSSLGNIPDTGYDPHRMATILGSGGTTGRAKGILWDNLTWSTLIAEACITLPASGPVVHLCVAPMTHAAGILTFMLTPHSPTNVVLDKIEPLEIMSAIERYKVTHLFLPPTALYAMLAHPRVREFDYSSLTHFLIAASPVAPDKLSEAVEIFGPCLCQCYGQVEAPMLVTYLPPSTLAEAAREPSLRHRLKSCGQPCALSLMAIMDDDGAILPTGERGEVVVRGDLVAPCYYKNPEGTAEAHRFGWHHTGDVAYCDQDGYVYIVDRKKDMIITGGFNVFSAEVEAAINGHAAVENCAVIGVPDPKWGEAVTAIVLLRPGLQATEHEIIEFAKQRLGSVKAPKHVEFWPELPRSPVGKVLKTEIRKKFWVNTERAVN
ncbi:MAG: ligase [Gammaproteobacteria bacterium]|nr:ligase [Gammaproteobacteria bacterium]